MWFDDILSHFLHIYDFVILLYAEACALLLSLEVPDIAGITLKDSVSSEDSVRSEDVKCV